MRPCFVPLIALMLLLAGGQLFAQAGVSVGAPTDQLWVTYWAQPPVYIFGPQQEDFQKNMQNIMFPWDNHEEPSNPEAIDANVQFLQSHPNVRFYIDGYASSRGVWDYNMALSQRRANSVKQHLISKGIPESRIVSAVGWGQFYPVCAELNEDCWNKNRLVRFTYSPN